MHAIYFWLLLALGATANFRIAQNHNQTILFVLDTSDVIAK